VLTPKFRGNYPALLKPELKDKKDPSKGYGYRIEALFSFDKNDPQLKEMVDAATQIIYEKHGRDASKWPAVVLPDGSFGPAGSALRSPFRNQAERAKDGVLPSGYVAGNCMMKFATTDKFAVGVADGTKGNSEVISPAEIYSGRWYVADVTPGYYDSNGNKGVTFYLNHVQLWEHDKPLDGRPQLGSVFKKVAGANQPAGGAPNPFA
jgi:hypothetical protein